MLLRRETARSNYPKALHLFFLLTWLLHRGLWAAAALALELPRTFIGIAGSMDGAILGPLNMPAQGRGLSITADLSLKFFKNFW